MTEPIKLDTASANAQIGQTAEPTKFMGRFWYQRSNRRWITGTGARLEKSYEAWELNEVPLPRTSQIEGIKELFERIAEKPLLSNLFTSLLDSSEKDIF